MAEYTAPLRDMQFVINELIGLSRVQQLAGFDEVSKDLSDAVLEEALGGRLLRAGQEAVAAGLACHPLALGALLDDEEGAVGLLAELEEGVEHLRALGRDLGDPALLETRPPRVRLSRAQEVADLLDAGRRSLAASEKDAQIAVDCPSHADRALQRLSIRAPLRHLVTEEAVEDAAVDGRDREDGLGGHLDGLLEDC